MRTLHATTLTTIPTEDGRFPTYEFTPEENGPWPGELTFMNGAGIRPAVIEIGERLSRAGYVVLLPDLYYRSGPYEPMKAKTVFTDTEQRATLISRFSRRRRWRMSCGMFFAKRHFPRVAETEARARRPSGARAYPG